MILGIMSDTHGHLTEMRFVAKKMIEEFGAEIIIHLGDDSTDAEDLRAACSEVITVPGVFEAKYADPNVPNRIIREFDGIPFLLNKHDLEGDIDPTETAQDGDAKVVLYGHTHQHMISEKHGAIYINPGHLKMDDNRGFEPSFAIIRTAPQKIDVKIIGLRENVLEEKTFFVE
ncbi:MAG: metallophosphoesterase family protein [Deltaproteobacteria bacterium]|nr:metallophosphoesterase family protein [Deltaproteobacteria bacterium]